jgi:hypothetical protein
MRRKEWVIIAAVVIIGASVTGWLVYRSNHKNNMSGMNMSTSVQSHATYTLNLMSGKNYPTAKPVRLHFAIQDQTGKVQKDFDTVHEKKLHLIVVRKDRTNFQHVHPTLDEKTGMFMLEGFSFLTDGQYPVYADFTVSGAQKDEMGMKLAATPYQDVQVGNTNKYSPQPIGSDKVASSVNGFDTNIFFAAGDDSPGGKPNTDFFAGQDSTIAISINKNGQSYANLQNYLGALGHMVVLGPKLEFIHVHPQTSDVNNQSGLVTFNVNFPEAGQYKLYLQTQADNQVNTIDYTLTAKPYPNTSSQSNNSMQGMEHMGH